MRVNWFAYRGWRTGGVSGTIREILARHPEGGTILIVGHAGANQEIQNVQVIHLEGDRESEHVELAR